MAYFLLVFSVFVGVLLAKLTQVKKYSDLFLTFSSAYLLGIVFCDLFPQVYLQKKIEDLGPLKEGFFVLLGVFIQILLTSLTQGIEHGHFHKRTTDQRKYFPYGIFIGLFFHSFLEGMPISSENYKLIAAMMVHKVPETIILYFFLLHVFKSQKMILALLFIFSLSTPFGSWMGEKIIFKPYYPYVLAFVCGIFIHIATHILFESADGKHRFKVSRLLVFLLGAFLSFLST